MAATAGPNYSPIPGDPWRALDWRGLDSSCLAACAYDAAVGRLFLRFRRGGRVYAYDRVSPQEYSALLDAPSAGAHFRSHVLGQFAERQVG